MPSFRLIAIAIVALLTLSSTGWTQQRAVLPGAKTAAEYSGYLNALAGYSLKVPGKLFDHGARIECADSRLTPVPTIQQLEVKRAVCDWYYQPTVVVRLHVWAPGSLTEQDALRRSLELTKRSAMASRDYGGIEISGRTQERASLADGNSIPVLRFSAKLAQVRVWTPYAAAHLPQRGTYLALLIAFATKNESCPMGGDGPQCAAALRALLANLQPQGDKLVSR